MRPSAFLVPVLCLASAVLVPLAQASVAKDQCGSQVLSLQDLNALARDAARADSVAPHSLYLHDAQMRSAFASLRDRTGRDAPTLALPSTAPAGDGFWQPGFGLPGLHEYPAAAIEYHGELVVSGWLRSAGAHPVSGIARWTDQGWEPLGDGTYPSFALAILGDRLYAGEYGRVSVWDGQSWTRLPQVPLSDVRALLVHDGALIAAGPAGQAGRVARFDGQTWQVLGGDFSAEVAALGTYRGQLIAGGQFRSYQGTPCGYVARWNGTTWESLGSGIDPTEYAGVKAIEEYGDRLIVGGWFSGCGGITSPGLAAWDGSSWSALAGAPPAYVNDLLVMDGALYIAGSFAGDYASVARWDGTTWTSEGLQQWTLGLAAYHGQLAAVGGFYGSGCPNPRSITGVATLAPDGWHGLERWEPAMHGLAHNAGAADVMSATLYRGDLVVAGTIGLAGNPPEWQTVSSPLRWDGQAWGSVGQASCARVVQTVGNDLIAAGSTGIARWDGAGWHQMGSGLSGWFLAIAQYHGEIYAGGELQVMATGQQTTLARFDGAEWNAVPMAPNAAKWNSPHVSALEVRDGLLYVGGNFDGAQSVASPGVVAWDGQRWRAVGSGVASQVLDLESYRGDLYAGGFGGVDRWDGTRWSSMGLEGTEVEALGRYGDKLVVAGLLGVDRFAPGSRGIVSWDGERWGGFGTGVNGQIYALQQVGGDLYAAGCFSYAGDQPSFSIARWAGSEPPPSPKPPSTVPPPAAGGIGVSPAFVTSDQALLTYSLPAAGQACLELFDTRGARVAKLCDRVAASGTNVLTWSPGSPAPFPQNGVYFLRLTVQGRTAHAKVIFSR